MCIYIYIYIYIYLGLYNTGIMEKKLETTIVYYGIYWDIAEVISATVNISYLIRDYMRGYAAMLNYKRDPSVLC